MAAPNRPVSAGIFGDIGRVLRGTATGFLAGGPAGAVAGGVLAAAGGGGSPTAPPVTPIARTGGFAAPNFGGLVPVRQQDPIQEAIQEAQGRRTRAFTGLQLGPFEVGVEREAFGDTPMFAPSGAQGAAGGCPAGFRPNKTQYFLKDGTFVPRGSRCVRVRRRNSLNPRALQKAISRVEGFKKATKKASRITVRKKC
jgi:hypothetical protein